MVPKAVLSQAYLEGTYSRFIRQERDLAGMQRFFKQFSFLAESAATRLRKRPKHTRGRRTGLQHLARLRSVYDSARLDNASDGCDARQRPGRWLRVGIATSPSTRSRDGAVLPVLHSMAQD